MSSFNDIYANHIYNMDQSIDVFSKLYDSGWQDVTYGYKIEPYDNDKQKPKIRRIGDIVYLRGAVKNLDSWTTHDSIITIPEEFCPIGCQHYSIQQGSGSNRYLLTINENGKCEASRYSNNTTMNNSVPVESWLNMYTSWFIN